MTNLPNSKKLVNKLNESAIELVLAATLEQIAISKTYDIKIAVVRALYNTAYQEGQEHTLQDMVDFRYKRN